MPFSSVDNATNILFGWLCQFSWQFQSNRFFSPGQFYVLLLSMLVSSDRDHSFLFKKTFSLSLAAAMIKWTSFFTLLSQPNSILPILQSMIEWLIEGAPSLIWTKIFLSGHRFQSKDLPLPGHIFWVSSVDQAKRSISLIQINIKTNFFVEDCQTPIISMIK